MAIFRPGHVVGAISGNLGAVNYATGPYGPYVRKRLVRTDKSTERQLASRAALQKAKSDWLDLTEEQRDSWKAAARGLKFRNRLGTPRSLSGFLVFLRMNMPYTADLVEFPLNPPVQIPTPPPTSLAFAVTLPNNYIMTWYPTITPGQVWQRIFTTRTLKDHVIRPLKYWRLSEIASQAGPTYNIKNAFVYAWGAPQVGEYVAVKLQMWQAERLPSIFMQAGCIVT